MMLIPKDNKYRISLLAIITATTIAIHYGWVVEPLFGHVHWFHVLHGRFCYIPIVMAASWFGLRGGLYSATVISLLVLPYIFSGEKAGGDLVGELVEILFYYVFAVLVGALVDKEFISRRKRQEAELHAQRSHQLSLVGQIAAGVAHEIKNPLASIKGAADIVVDESTELSARREFGDILQSEVKRIDSTVTEFLEFARPRETKLELTNFSEIVTTCVRQVGNQARSNNIKIESKIENGLMVNGDPEKLHQMTLNLLLNAVQALDNNPVDNEEVVSVALSQSDDNHVLLKIMDRGTGIETADLDHVFEPFFTTKATGTGLGLAIVKSIVDDHSGRVRLESNADSGTVAIVEFPIFG